MDDAIAEPVLVNPILQHHPDLPFLDDIEVMRDAVRGKQGEQPPIPHKPFSLWVKHTLGQEAWAKVFCNSFFPYHAFTYKEFTGAYESLLTSSLYEYHLAEQYRRDLVLTTAGGSIRHVLHDCLPAALTVNSKHLHSDGTSHLQWWDGLYPPRLPLKTRERYELIILEDIVHKRLKGEINATMRLLTKADVCRLSSGRHEPEEKQFMAAEVWHTIDQLWRVRAVPFPYRIYANSSALHIVAPSQHVSDSASLKAWSI